MFVLDLFNTDHERRIAEGAVDQLEQRRIDDLAMKMDDLVARAKNPAYKKNPAALAALMKEFQKCKAERDSYYKIRNETMGYGSLGEGQMKQEMHKAAERMTLSQFIDRYGDEDWIREFWNNVNGPIDEATGDDKFDAMMGKISKDPWTQLNSDPNWEYEIEELVDQYIEPWLLAMEKSGMPITRDNETLNPGWRKRYEQVSTQLAQKYLASKKFNPRDPDMVGRIRAAIDWHTDESRNVHGQLSAYADDLPLQRYADAFDADGMTANIRDAMAGLAPRDDDNDGYAPPPAANPRRLDPGNMEEGNFIVATKPESPEEKEKRDADSQARTANIAQDQARAHKRDILQSYAKLGRMRTEAVWALENDVYMNKDQILDYIEKKSQDPSLSALEYMHDLGHDVDGLFKNVTRFLTGAGISPAKIQAVQNKITQRMGEINERRLAEEAQAKTDDALRAHLEKVKREKQSGVPSSVPTEKIPGKEDLLKGKGRTYYEDQKKNSEQVDEYISMGSDKNYVEAEPYKNYKIYVRKKPFGNTGVYTAHTEVDRKEFMGKGNSQEEAVQAARDRIDFVLNAQKKVTGSSTIDFNVKFATDLLADPRQKFYAKLENISGQPKLVIASADVASDPELVAAGDFKGSALRNQVDDEGRATPLPGIPLTAKSLRVGDWIANGRYTIGNETTDRDGNRIFDLTYHSTAHTKSDKLRLNQPAFTLGTARELDEDKQLHVGDPITVTAPNEFEGKTGEIYDFSPSRSFVIVDLYNHGKHSMHLSDVEYNQYADKQEEDDWYDEKEMNEGWSDAIVARRTGRPRTPYSVYIKGKKWKDFENDDHAEAVANKLRAKFKAEGRDPSVITIAPTDIPEGVAEESQDDRNARIIAGEIEDAMSQGNQQLVKRKKQELQQLGYYFDKQGRLQAMGMYETALNPRDPQGDYAAKRKALHDLSLNKDVDQAAVLQRRLDLDREAKAKGIAEGAMSNLHADLADVYNRMAPGIERNRDSFKAGQLYDALEAVAEQHGAEAEFKRMMNGARNRAHMDYDTNPGGFQNWFWYLPFDQEELSEEQDTSGVERAILNRVMVAHTDLLMKFGPEKVMQAAEEVAYNVGDVDEIGTSDVSAYVNQVKQILGVPEEVNEKWSQKYKSSINCANPKGFSQKAHCAGRKK
jgi:hypothetical protein